MDKLKSLFKFIIINLLILGCTDLKESPRGLLTPGTFFSTQADLEAAVTAAYRPLLTVFANT